MFEGFNAKNTSVIHAGCSMIKANNDSDALVAAVSTCSSSSSAISSVGGDIVVDAASDLWLQQVAASPERGVAPSTTIPKIRTSDIIERFPDIKTTEFTVTQRVMYPHGRTFKQLVEVWTARKKTRALTLHSIVSNGVGSNMVSRQVDKGYGILVISTGNRFNENGDLLNGRRTIYEP